jgi:hypothetical protein
MADFRSGSNGISRGKLAPRCHSPFGTRYISHHEVFSGAYPFVFHGIVKPVLTRRFLGLAHLNDDCHIRTVDHAVPALGARSFINHFRGEKSFPIQHIGAAKNILGADKSANATINDPFTCLPQYVDFRQFAIPHER